MGPKKKIQSQPKSQQPTSISPKLRTIKCSDGSIFTINDILLSKYSNKLRKKIQQFKSDQIIQLDDYIDKTTFKYIEQFLLLRKDKQIPIINFPIKSNINLKYIMDENDAVLMQKIESEGGLGLVSKLLEIATNLEMEELRKRLFCVVALKLSTMTVDQLKQVYEIPSNIEANEDQLKLQMKNHLEQLKRTQQKKIQEQ